MTIRRATTTELFLQMMTLIVASHIKEMDTISLLLVIQIWFSMLVLFWEVRQHQRQGLVAVNIHKEGSNQECMPRM